MKKQSLPDNAGLSLIEITFAMGILAVALSLIFGSMISVLVIGRINEERAVANTELSSILESMRGMPLSDLVTYAPEKPAHPGADRTIQLECFDADGASISLPMSLATDPLTGKITGPLPDLPNPVEVKATLLWTRENGQVYKSYITTSIGR